MNAIVSGATFPAPLTITTPTYSVYYRGSLSEPESESPMTTITTLAQLEAIPIDRIVRVDGVDWTRTEKGLARDGVDLALLYFEGRVVAGTMIDLDNLPPVAGEWWGGTTRTYYLVRVDDTWVRYISFRGGAVQNWIGSSRRRTWDTSTSVHRLTGAPSELANNGMEGAAVAYGALHTDLLDARAEVERLTSENSSLRDKVQASARKPEIIRNSLNAIRTNLDAIAQLMEE